MPRYLLKRYSSRRHRHAIDAVAVMPGEARSVIRDDECSMPLPSLMPPGSDKPMPAAFECQSSPPTSHGIQCHLVGRLNVLPNMRYVCYVRMPTGV